MNNEIAVALIATIVPTLTVLGTWWQQRRKVGQIHEIVNSQRTAMEKTIREQGDNIKTNVGLISAQTLEITRLVGLVNTLVQTGERRKTK